ncbi:MAG: hypothetical protein Q9201_001786 [Fulgogasparrea decipioides]
MTFTAEDEGKLLNRFHAYYDTVTRSSASQPTTSSPVQTISPASGTGRDTEANTIFTSASSSQSTTKPSFMTTAPNPAPSSAMKDLRKKDMGLGAGIGIPIAVLALTALAYLFIRERKRRKRTEQLAQESKFRENDDRSRWLQEPKPILDSTGIYEKHGREAAQELGSRAVGGVEMDSNQIHEAMLG